MTSIVHAGAQFLNNVLSPTQDSSYVFRQEIVRRMGVYESAYRREHDSSVLSLYCHWFMSLFAFMECIARYAIHIGGLVVVTVFYYFYVCITCGKNHLSFRALLTTQSRLFGLYWGLSCGIFWNIVFPWRPPMYAYHVINLTRPDVTDVESLQHLLESTVLQGFLLSYGGCRGGGTCGDLDAYAEKLRAEVVEDNRELTRQFYMQEYGFPTYEETMHARSGGGLANPHVPSAPTIVVATAVPIDPGPYTSRQNPQK